jgi:peptidoglycan/LPS O-acetylase OafA/YrhL
MLITLGLFILVAAFAIALALFWWFLTHVLPVLILLYIICAVIRCYADAREPARRDPSE